jgi:two-component system alkaline phosphatase synthesis response regulator PhoP
MDTKQPTPPSVFRGGLIYIIEDDYSLARLLETALQREGFRIRIFSRAEEALSSVRSDRPRLILLDLMLPGLDGLTFLKTLRERYQMQQTPVLIISARDEEADRVIGLELGADDYLTKPFGLREALARIHALLRRASPAAYPSANPPVSCGNLSLDPDKYQCLVSGKPVDLSVTEFRLLYLLVAQPDRVFSREDILSHLWSGKSAYDRTIDAHIKNIRKKLGKTGDHIQTVRGAGYKWASS